MSAWKVITLCSIVSAAPVLAQNVQITEGVPEVQFEFNGGTVFISRDQNTDARLPKDFTLTARACPPHCIEPTVAASGVATVTELDVIGFLQRDVTAGRGLLLDARLPEEFVSGSIPAAVNVPHATMVGSNPYLEDLLLALGAKGRLGAMSFEDAFDLLVFGEGPWSDTARRAVTHLIAAGYPSDKLRFYRGGMQMWNMFALNTVR